MDPIVAPCVACESFPTPVGVGGSCSSRRSTALARLIELRVIPAGPPNRRSTLPAHGLTRGVI